MLLNFCNAPECIKLYVWVLLCGLCALLNGLPHPSPVCKPQGQGKYSYVVAHGRMTVITMG